MQQHLPVLLILCLSPFLFQSCAQLRETIADEEETAINEVVKATEEPEEITGLPEWHNPLNPVQITGDSLIISAAAVAADSSDAKTIAELSLAEYRNKGLTDILFLLLDEEGVDVLEEPAAPEAEKALREKLVRLYASANGETEQFTADSGSVWWHREDGQVRCYIRQAYKKSELYEAVRMQIRQNE